MNANPYILKGDGLGIFCLNCFNTWKKYQLEFSFDIRKKKFCSQRLVGRKIEGRAFFPLVWNQSIPKRILDIILCLFYHAIVKFPLLFHCCACSAAQFCPTLCDSLDCSPPGSFVHGISQARILEWVAISFSRGSSWLRDRSCVSCVSCTAGRFFAAEPPGKHCY